jgi:hypothetical protein
LATSRSVSQSLADDAADRALGALYIINAKRDSVAVPKIEFGEVTVKVFLADLLVDAVNAALQDRKIVLGGISGGVSARTYSSCT